MSFRHVPPLSKILSDFIIRITLYEYYFTLGIGHKILLPMTMFHHQNNRTFSPHLALFYNGLSGLPSM